MKSESRQYILRVILVGICSNVVAGGLLVLLYSGYLYSLEKIILDSGFLGNIVMNQFSFISGFLHFIILLKIDLKKGGSTKNIFYLVRKNLLSVFLYLVIINAVSIFGFMTLLFLSSM